MRIARTMMVLLGMWIGSACTPTDADAPLRRVVGSKDPLPPSSVTYSPDAVFLAASSTAPGDTLAYTLSWGAGTNATGYVVTTTASGTGWTGLLTNAPTAALSMQFKPINVSGWTSVDFSACVASTRPGKPTSAPRCVTWTLVRAPGVPGPIVVDSSMIIAGFILIPHSATTTTDVAVPICPYFEALDGKVRLVDGYNGSLCRRYYDDSIPAAKQLPGYPIQYDVATSVHEWGGLRLATRSPRDQLAHEMFASR